MKNKIQRLIVALAVTAAICSLPVVSAAADSTATTTIAKTATIDISSGVTHSYNADTTVQDGMIVELKATDTNTVIPLPQGSIQNMLGVVIPSQNATIVLSPENVKQQQVLVGTSGTFNVLVSNQNGRIKSGDYITISAVDGVGMRADDGQQLVLGRAGGDFNGTSNVLGSVQLKDSLGKSVAISLGRIPVQVNISHNPAYQKSVDYVPGFLAKVAVTVANKPVSAARIYLSLSLLLATVLIVGNMLYSGVRSGMNAVGRNPLTKKSIIRSLIQTVFAGMIIFVVGVLAVYLILKL
jgi:hypothetical protein